MAERELTILSFKTLLPRGKQNPYSAIPATGHFFAQKKELNVRKTTLV